MLRHEGVGKLKLVAFSKSNQCISNQCEFSFSKMATWSLCTLTATHTFTHIFILLFPQAVGSSISGVKATISEKFEPDYAASIFFFCCCC